MGKKFLGLGGTDHFWDRAKAWILNQITSAVAAKIAEVVANAPEDLDTLKEIADWISTHADDAAAMNTQINENKNNIAANASSISAMNTQINENKNNIAANASSISAMNTQIQVNAEAIAGKADKAHTHTKSQITDFPTSLKNPNALTVNGKTYDGSEAVDAGVQTVENGGTGATTAHGAFENLANGLLEGAGPEDAEHIIFKNASGKDWGLYTLSQFWEYIKGKISSVLGLTKDNYGGKASTAGTADRATGIAYTGEGLNCISAQQTPESYNNSTEDWASYIICNHGYGTTYFHQMLRLSFFYDKIQLQRRENGELKGWKNVAIIENENTWSGRQNFNTAKASSKMVIPIGAPSQLEDGCIWIER